MLSILRPARAALLLLVFASGSVLAQGDYFFPDADNDPPIPSIQDVLGYEPGERITWHRDAVRYIDAL